MSAPQEKPDPDWLETQLFSQVNETTKLYAIVDGQWCKDIYGRLETYRNDLVWTGLIAGEQATELALTAPYLVRLEKGHKLTRWLLDEGWGQGWGIYFHADTQCLESYRKPPPEPHKNQLTRTAFVEAPGMEGDEASDVILLRRHFRKFQRVEFEDNGRLVRFRFFDPAVLRIYLLSCNDKEIECFFGSAILNFISEDYCEEPELCRPNVIYRFWRFDEGKLKAQSYDILNQQRKDIELFPAANEPAERSGTALLPLIRNAQIKIFEQMQLEIFIEQIAYDIARIGEAESRGAPNLKNIRAFTRKQVQKARAHGIERTIDVGNFVMCAFYLGDRFEQTSTELMRLLEQKTDPDGLISGALQAILDTIKEQKDD